MRKLLVLALVLGIACLANAGLTVKVDGSTVTCPYTSTIGTEVTFDWDYTGVDFYTAIVADGAMTVAGTLANMPDASMEFVSSIFDPETGDPLISGVATGFDGPIWTIASYSTGVTKPEALFFTIDGFTKPITVQLLAIDGDTFAATVLREVTLTPEPMTMLLLGLGGLFLRKR